MKIAWIVDFQRVCYNLSQLIHIFKLTPAQAKTIHFLKKEKLYFYFITYLLVLAFPNFTEARKKESKKKML